MVDTTVCAFYDLWMFVVDRTIVTMVYGRYNYSNYDVWSI